MDLFHLGRLIGIDVEVIYDGVAKDVQLPFLCGWFILMELCFRLSVKTPFLHQVIVGKIIPKVAHNVVNGRLNPTVPYYTLSVNILFNRVPTPPGKSWNFLYNFQDLESPGKWFWSWKVLEKFNLKILEVLEFVGMRMQWCGLGRENILVCTPLLFNFWNA